VLSERGPRAAWHVLAVVVILGLIVMHHLTGVSHHDDASMVEETAPAVGVMAPASGAVALAVPAQHHDDITAGVVVMSSAGDNPMNISMLMHLCMAALAALLTLAAVALLLWRRRAAPAQDPAALAAAFRRRERAPPVPVRLAQLQVLRL
jgi:hypothetical protein